LQAHQQGQQTGDEKEAEGGSHDTAANGIIL
jgi:hypothetical protein